MTAYLTLKILRSSPRRHRGERTTTIPMKTPPLPVNLTVAGCFILCRREKFVLPFFLSCFRY